MAWIHAVVDVPADQHAAASDFWGGVFGWPVGEPWEGHPELSSFEPPRGTAYVHLQRIEGPSRIHVDLESEDPDDSVARAVELGAHLVAERDSWRTLTSPGGLPFCVLRAEPHESPEPVTFEDGHRSRLVQVCVDSPRAVHQAEVDFWQALLDGRWVPSGAEEFAGKWHDDAGSPIQLLFQRLDEPDGPVRAHLDVGTDDLSADVRRLRQLGATDVGRGRRWHVFLDPSGHPFCTTENSPEQIRRRDLG
jgi:predicted enzyme related to lactoylglutathione lyase